MCHYQLKQAKKNKIKKTTHNKQKRKKLQVSTSDGIILTDFFSVLLDEYNKHIKQEILVILLIIDLFNIYLSRM